MSIRFVILAPPWRHSSAGVQVLHKLCHQMRQCSADAYVTSPGNPAWDNPQIDKIVPDDYIIYPDIIVGNPEKCKHVIRYMLYYPQMYFKCNRITKNELCIPFAAYLWPDLNHYCDYPIPEEWITELSIIEPELFFIDKSIKKDLNTFWIGKGGENYQNFHMPKDAILIPPSPRADHAHWLKRSKNFYCFDMNSNVPMEAHLCGAKVFIVGADCKILQWWGYTWEQNKLIYNDLDRIKNFIKIATEFDYGT
jgi:hypothetical protein